jgi:hypothetical protein
MAHCVEHQDSYFKQSLWIELEIMKFLTYDNVHSGVEIQEYGRRDPSRWPRGTLYPQMLAPTSPTSV